MRIAVPAWPHRPFCSGTRSPLSVGIPVPAAAPTPPRDSDPGRFGRGIALVDWAVFLATLLVSAVVYLLTLYDGKHFGATSQYIEAFGAGFAGQALVGVATIPLARSLVSVVPKKAE
jgi:hypothetical protein